MDNLLIFLLCMHRNVWKSTPMVMSGFAAYNNETMAQSNLS